jgi:hypothetical protein
MAGSNQAQPLTGLLNSLTGAFNQQDMGQGMMFAQNIRDYNAPVLDANDPNSVLDRQRWAQRNGYQEEAVAMGSALGKLNAENQLKEENAEKATRMANMFGNMIPNMPEERQDEARSVRDALANGEMTYKEALDWLEEAKTGGVDPTSSWQTAALYARDYNESRGLKPGDDEYMTVSDAFDRTAKVTRDVDNARLVAAGTEAGKRSIVDQTAAIESLALAQQQADLYDQAIALSQDGANTGQVYDLLPTVKARTIELENIRNRLGLGIVAAGKFGQLTEKELKVAFDTAIPTNLPRKELQEWLEARKSAELKMANLQREFLEWQSANPGRTRADWQVQKWAEINGKSDAEGAVEKDPVTGKTAETQSFGVLSSDANKETEPKSQGRSDDELISIYGVTK